MGYKWKPNKTQRREFAKRMQDPEQAAAYWKAKEERATKKRNNSKYNYQTAGGNYVPTEYQFKVAGVILTDFSATHQQRDAANQIIYGYTCKEKVHHDYIHVVNEYSRHNDLNI